MQAKIKKMAAPLFHVNTNPRESWGCLTLGRHVWVLFFSCLGFEALILVGIIGIAAGNVVQLCVLD